MNRCFSENSLEEVRVRVRVCVRVCVCARAHFSKFFGGPMRVCMCVNVSVPLCVCVYVFACLRVGLCVQLLRRQV